MKLVKAKCTQCGAELDVNPEAECLICKYCGTPFIVTKAINNYNLITNNNVVNNIQANNVIVNGFDEKKELEKARKLVGKDNNLASKLYANIFENNADNFEAQYLRIILNDEEYTINVPENKLRYNKITKMSLYETEYHQEDRPLYSDYEKKNATQALFRKAIDTNTIDIKPILRTIYPIKEMVNGEIIADYFYLNFDLESILFLYSKEETRTALEEKIKFFYDLYITYGDSYLKVAFNEEESLLTQLDPSYQKQNLPEHQKKAGCYIATCVYGSYDCPEVWVLRRFRDNKLSSTWLGRVFIKIYYAISPIIVKWFGETKWFKTLWKRKLDKMVEKCRHEGFENTPYEDKKW